MLKCTHTHAHIYSVSTCAGRKDNKSCAKEMNSHLNSLSSPLISCRLVSSRLVSSQFFASFHMLLYYCCCSVSLSTCIKYFISIRNICFVTFALQCFSTHTHCEKLSKKKREEREEAKANKRKRILYKKRVGDSLLQSCLLTKYNSVAAAAAAAPFPCHTSALLVFRLLIKQISAACRPCLHHTSSAS